LFLELGSGLSYQIIFNEKHEEVHESCMLFRSGTLGRRTELVL